MSRMPLTVVRFSKADGRALLERFASRDRHAAAGVPRGIERSQVGEFIYEKLTPETKAEVWFRVLELMRFYEMQEVLPHLLATLDATQQREEEELFYRTECVLQALGDFGEQTQIARAGGYLEQIIATDPLIMPGLSTVSESIIALSSEGSFEQLRRRITYQAALAEQAQYQSPAALRSYQQTFAMQRNYLPKLEYVLAGKRRLESTQPDLRRRELVAVYLKRSALATHQTEVWAARLLRFEAIMGNAEAVINEFAAVLDEIANDGANEALRRFVVERAGQAIIYFRGTLTKRQQALFQEANSNSRSFLSDGS